MSSAACPYSRFKISQYKRQLSSENSDLTRRIPLGTKVLYKKLEPWTLKKNLVKTLDREKTLYFTGPQTFSYYVQCEMPFRHQDEMRDRENCAPPVAEEATLWRSLLWSYFLSTRPTTVTVVITIFTLVVRPSVHMSPNFKVEPELWAGRVDHWWRRLAKFV